MVIPEGQHMQMEGAQMVGEDEEVQEEEEGQNEEDMQYQIDQ